MADRAKEQLVDVARRLEKMGFELLATKGTAQRLELAGVKVQRLTKIQEGRPNVLDYMRDGQLQLVLNTPSGKGARTDEGKHPLRRGSHWASPASPRSKPPKAAVRAMEALRGEELTVQAVQDRFPRR